MESSITLSELTAKLCPSQQSDDLRKFSRKIQNWVTDGIVLPVTGKNEGRGVHRRYDQHETYKIAVLFEASRFKLPGVVLQELSVLFDDSRPIDPAFQNKTGVRHTPAIKKKITNEFNQLIKRAIEGDTAYLSLTPDMVGDDLQVKLSSDEGFIQNSSSAIVLNLTKILSGLTEDTP